MQVKYKEGVKKEAGPALYHLLPETADTQRAKHMSEIQSEVLAPPPTAPPSPFPTQRNSVNSQSPFQTQYRKEREELADSLFSVMPDTLQTSFTRELAETHSQVSDGGC